MQLLLGFITVILLVSSALLVKEPTGKSKKPSIAQAFKKANITPSVVCEAPPKILEVKYKNAEVNLGNDIYPGDTSRLPKIKFDYEPGRLYVIIMIVVTSEEVSYLSPVLKMLYVNVVEADLKLGCEVANYYPPNPIPGTGKSACVILAYKQDCFIDSKDPDLTKYQNKRYGFPFADFVKNYTLSLCAGNFFYAEFPDDPESYCDELSC